MSNTMDAEEELFNTGLTSYWDARAAMESFEQSIANVAREAMKSRLSDIKEALGSEKEIGEEHIGSVRQECKFYRVIVGASCGWDPGFHLGVGWRKTSEAPIAICSVPSNAVYRRDLALKALKKYYLERPHAGIEVIPSPDWPYNAVAWSALSAELKSNELLERLSVILGAVIDWSIAAGGLRTVMHGQQNPTSSPTD